MSSHTSTRLFAIKAHFFYRPHLHTGQPDIIAGLQPLHIIEIDPHLQGPREDLSLASHCEDGQDDQEKTENDEDPSITGRL